MLQFILCHAQIVCATSHFLEILKILVQAPCNMGHALQIFQATFGMDTQIPNTSESGGCFQE